jgi:photosystem II stability/assembly factor-like uncharacterized protein
VAVHSVAVDTRGPSPRLLAGIEYGHFGPSVLWSDDFGATWEEAERPPVAFPERTETALSKVWQLTPSPSEPGVVWAGAEPAALFRSEDGGKTYSLIESLWDHPTRPEWQPGGGGLCLHTIIPHPADPRRMGVAASSVGFFRTEDGGRSWQPSNRNIRTPYRPEGSQYPEWGQCVHKVAQNPATPERLYLQHHFGVYRSDDFGAEWTDIGKDLPSDFGFSIAVHPSRPDTIYVFPLQADMDRTPIGHRPKVFRSDDGGDSWQPFSAGLPQDDVYSSVLRDALTASDAGIFFGTRDGEVYGSRDDGETWTQIAGHLPDVFVVRAAVV